MINTEDIDKWPSRKHPVTPEMISVLGHIAYGAPLTRDYIVAMIKAGHPRESVKQHLERIEPLWRAARSLCWDGYASSEHENRVFTVRITEDGKRLWQKILDASTGNTK